MEYEQDYILYVYGTLFTIKLEPVYGEPNRGFEVSELFKDCFTSPPPPW